MQTVTNKFGNVNFELTFQQNHSLWLAAKTAIRRHADAYSRYAVECYAQANDFEALADLMKQRGVRAIRIATKRNQARIWRTEGDRAAHIAQNLRWTLAGDRPESMLNWMAHLAAKQAVSATLPAPADQLALI